MFIAAAGGVVVIAAAYSDTWAEYNDSEMRDKIARKQSDIEDKQQQVDNKKSDVEDKEWKVDDLRNRMYDDFNARVRELGREKNYSGLNSGAYSMVEDVKEDMRREIDKEVQNKQKQLDKINNIIAKINEIELQSKKR